MNSLVRNLGLALLLLLVFLAVALAVQTWLHRETVRLQAETVAARRAQFTKAIEVTHRPPETWDAGYLRELGALAGGTVTLTGRDRPPPAEPSVSGMLEFDYPLAGGAGWMAHVSFPAPAGIRFVGIHQRMLAAMVLLALLLALVPVLMALSRRTAPEAGSPTPWKTTRTEMHGLEHFARMTVERSAELERESGVRRRVEEDLLLSRAMLGQSFEERIRLGRDLHDSLSQTLYAVSLTLESVRNKLAPAGPGPADPALAESQRRIDRCIAELRRLNQEVRAYIKELEPTTIQRQSFVEALTAMLAALPVDDAAVRLEHRIDVEAAALIPSEQTAEVVNIVREAVSNSLRHGRARTVVVRLQRGDAAVALAVQDDGAGFDPGTGGRRGHGLENMRARAEALGGSLQIASTLGKGTRVSLTLPVASTG